jgi:hypothetical protein
METAVQQNPIVELANRLVAIRDEKDALAERGKELNKLEEETERQLFELMISEDLEKFTYAGRTFRPEVKTYASIKAEWKEEAFAWLKENGFGDLVKEQVNAQSLTSLYKELDESGELPEEFAQLLNVYQKQRIAVRRGRG